MNEQELAQRLERRIRTIPNYPKPGIQFKDITTLLGDAEGFKESIEWMASVCKRTKVDRVAGIESRGFIFGAALANRIGVGFVPIRKKGKLPYDTVSARYFLEYGADAVEMHVDAIHPGESVVMVDDLLATGGTAEAACRLIDHRQGKVAACLFLIELAFLPGRERLRGRDVHAIIQVKGE